MLDQAKGHTMTTTPMSAERREELRVSAGFGTRGGINASEIEWLLDQAARAEVLRAEVDAGRAWQDTDARSTGMMMELSSNYTKARAATDALEKETGHGE